MPTAAVPGWPSSQKLFASITGDIDLLTTNGNNGPAVAIQVFGNGTITLIGRDEAEIPLTVSSSAPIFGQYIGIKNGGTATSILVIWE